MAQKKVEATKMLHHAAMLAGNFLDWWVQYVGMHVSQTPLTGKGRVVHFLITHIVASAATSVNKEDNTLVLGDAVVVKAV